jgi:uncharacterized 2Fe-2S/4Fe-4S cluster protein (DUF4445 family)
VNKNADKAGSALVVFSPSGKKGHFPVGTALLQAARELGVDIDSICGGRARCGRCQVEAVEGSFAKEGIVSSPEHLSVMGEDEQYCQQRGRLKDGNRLSCQSKILGDLRIDVPASSQVHNQVVRKDFEAHDVELDPVVHLYFTEVAEPDLHRPEGDLQRLMKALEQDWRLTGLSWDMEVLQSLQAALREGKWQVTVAIRNNERIVAVWPGFRDRIYGAAIDVGSTTIAVHLCDLASGEVLASSGAMNPQIRFGEDLMSRVSYAMLNPEGAGQMTKAVREAVSELIYKTTRQAEIDTADVLELTLVGNPIMHHLLLGLDPTPLGTAPFALASDHAVELFASELDIRLRPNARAYLLPCIAGHVGADTAAVLLAEMPWESEEITLIIDVGTNAEIILGNRHKLLAASSPTGPAFEGAQISSGQRAAPGAIERVRIDPETLEPVISVIGCELWSDDPGFKDAMGEQAVTGICGSGIIEAIAGMYLAGIIRSDGVIDGAAAERSTRVRASERTFSYLLHEGEPEICIQQGDVRAIQLAKAALYAGARLLMDHMGVDKVDRIRLAGAFGSHIDVKYAMVLGMIPDCELERVSSANNAAGTGARIALLNRASRREIEDRVRQIEKVETAVDENFQKHFVDAMGIPHSSYAYPQLSKFVQLPKPHAAGAGSSRKRRRRSRGS